MSTSDPKRCPICGNAIIKPRRGPTGETCSAACRQELYRLRHPEIVVLNFSHVGDATVARLVAKAMRTYGGDHEEVVGAVTEHVERIVADAPNRAKDVLEALLPWLRAMDRGRTAKQDDVFKVAPRLIAIQREVEREAKVAR